MEEITEITQEVTTADMVITTIVDITTIITNLLLIIKFRTSTIIIRDSISRKERI